MMPLYRLSAKRNNRWLLQPNVSFSFHLILRVLNVWKLIKKNIYIYIDKNIADWIEFEGNLSNCFPANFYCNWRILSFFFFCPRPTWTTNKTFRKVESVGRGTNINLIGNAMPSRNFRHCYLHRVWCNLYSIFVVRSTVFNEVITRQMFVPICDSKF